jgi:hypothetical protein
MYTLAHRFIASEEEYDDDENFSGDEESGIDEESPRSSQSDEVSSLDQSKTNKFNKQFYESGESNFGQGMPLRASTAPARPLTELEEFRRSSDFLLLESTVVHSQKLI